MYTDSDFASDKSDSKSVSGIFLAVGGTTTYFPISAQSKKQTSVSHCTAESEMVAADAGLRMEGITGAYTF